ncbi:hypothetical protein NDU88_000222 [Pleurodeles waltl]|uniref:Uncharacterized protein n=1 Tax=Pleurodeles waltl TaxID=8319 RepID=A0AAV7LUU3_PLEWA|nr:hypothetical protein NDU88_000222 [Pleurodeles waltl]
MRAVWSLRTACERAKRTLYSSTQASIEIDSLFEGIDFYTSITRARFEELGADLFRGTLDPVEKALRDAKLDKSQIHDIVLVGGCAQIEVSFDINGNGILSICAVDKSSGKKNKITISNDNGWLSKEEIERMVQEAERYKAGDEAQREKVLESYTFNMKSTVEDDNLKDKIREDDRKKIVDKSNQTVFWLENHQRAEKEACEHQQKALEKVCDPIITKL